MEDNGNGVGNCILKVALLMNGTSVFPSVVVVILHLFVSWFKTFQTDVALPHPTELSLLFWHWRFHQFFKEHMVESLGSFLDVIAKDLYPILTSIEPLWILDLSVRECSISTESRGNMMIDISLVYEFRESL